MFSLLALEDQNRSFQCPHDKHPGGCKKASLWITGSLLSNRVSNFLDPQNARAEPNCFRLLATRNSVGPPLSRRLEAWNPGSRPLSVTSPAPDHPGPGGHHLSLVYCKCLPVGSPLAAGGVLLKRS